MRIVRYNLTEDPDLKDPWILKIVNMLRLREKFKQEYGLQFSEYFRDKYPIYDALLTTAEDTTSGGFRDMLEAVLLSTPNTEDIDSVWKHPKFDSVFLGAYRKMFYDVVAMMQHPALVFKYVVTPMASADSNSLAIGHIWKLLAISGGLNLLMRKGFGTGAIQAEDIEHLLQLASFRNCSNMLQYVAEGKAFFADNPSAATAINALCDFDSIRAAGRRTDYLAELSSVSKNNLSTLLTGELKLINMPDQRIRELVEFDGTFRPEIDGVMEFCEHKNYIET